MVNITIRNVPEATRDVFAERAAAAGQSMQEYVRALLVEAAAREDINDVFARIAARVQGRAPISTEQIVEGIREDRGR